MQRWKQRGKGVVVGGEARGRSYACVTVYLKKKNKKKKTTQHQTNECKQAHMA